MSSNVYTKNQMIKELSDKGFFIDSYTLDTFFKNNKIDALFENEKGEELFDAASLDLVVKKLFPNTANEQIDKEPIAAPPVVLSDKALQQEVPSIPILEDDNQNSALPSDDRALAQDTVKLPELSSDKEVMSVLNTVTLSDGAPLVLEVEKELKKESETQKQNVEAVEEIKFQNEPKQEFIEEELKNKTEAEEQPLKIQEDEDKILKDDTLNVEQNQNSEHNIHDEHSSEDSDIDDLTLLSESFEAQEKFRDYVVSELSKKNFDMTPPQKVDYSQKMLDEISRAIAKKIVKQVNDICTNGANFSVQLAELKRKIARIELKNKELEKQNKKLRLLLAETNKNLNSYRPSIFGLYKKEVSKTK